jgi:hypothetical protein
MSWEIDDCKLDSFFKPIQEVNLNAVLRIESGRIYCRCLSLCNTTYATFERRCNAVGNGIHPFNIDRIVSVLDSGDVRFSYINKLLTIKRGKSTFRITELAPNVVKEPSVLNFTNTEGVLGIKTQDLYAALKDMGNYYAKEERVPSVKLFMQKQGLLIKDNEEQMDIEVVGSSTPELSSVVIAYDLMTPIIHTIRTYYETVDLYIAHEKPLLIRATNDNSNMLVAIAPKVVT